MASSACGDGADVATARDARSRTRVKKQIMLAVYARFRAM